LEIHSLAGEKPKPLLPLKLTDLVSLKLESFQRADRQVVIAEAEYKQDDSQHLEVVLVE
jgi:hypothetical protein